MFLGQSLVVGSVSAPEDFARDDNTLSTPAKAFDRIPHYDLSVAVSIGLRIIEEVHTGIVGGRHALDCDLLANLATVRHPCTQGQLAQF